MSRSRTICLLPLVMGALANVVHPVCDAADVPIQGIEYKLRLSLTKFRAEGPDGVRKLLGVAEAAEPKKCRLIQFLDVDGDFAQGAGYIVRHRAELDQPGKACPDHLAEKPATKDQELTFKFRTSDGDRVVAETQLPWWQKAKEKDRKLEQDIGLSKTGDGRLSLGRAYSASVDVEADAPVAVDPLRKAFPNALAPFAADAALAVSGGRILEDRWKLKPTDKPDKPQLPDEIDLVEWSCVGKNGAKSAEPLLVELSFKTTSKDADAQKQAEAPRRADGLMLRLLQTVDASWLAEGGSKTEAASGCKE